MYLKLNIKSLVFEGEIEVLRDALPLLNGIVATLTDESPAELPAKPMELPAPQPAAEPCCDQTAAPKARQVRKAPKTKPKRAYKPRKPQPEPEPDEPAGSVRVDTGRSKKRETLDALRKHGPCGAARLAAMVGGGVTPAAMYQRLLGLLGDGEIQAGAERGTYQVIDE
jgi:hypothetical protein